ncbi:RNA-directed DNA polymerase [Haliea sp. E1-2-M8]|uniref:RNA-directed DNA polymerase n=1 Tax=Haliea sp. E1-2-M8 TaxID=3064706 RepID=UPI0027286342|nr:RNA-directed DNA polymerase [Haliea sp. E1-2-M8]MDO8861844.1 RNA-directed DNA polymerase [Haliea sp. E1-2-M8]
MKRLIEASHEEAKAHFLKCSSYFNGDFPKYISFEPVLAGVAAVLNGEQFTGFQSSKPAILPGVNYSFLANKDGRFAWRPYELMHPAIYVSLVNLICTEENWFFIKGRVSQFEQGAVTCCSSPVISLDHQTDQATQIRSWWQSIEQQSLIYSLEYSHVLHTDVTDCYGSLYTHSIAWALHGLEEAKQKPNDKSLLGNNIDFHIRSSRYGQTNGISQGSVLMDFIAELVLGYVDECITSALTISDDVQILRYRDDYRIFANSDDRAEEVLKIASDALRGVGMKLGVPKTYMCTNVVEGSIKPDKLAGIELRDLGDSNAKTIQKQLLRLHAFGRRFPNSGALRRLTSEFHSKLATQTEPPDDLEVQIAIATDIALVSPVTIPVVAGMLSHLISLAPQQNKARMWDKVHRKMQRVPHNGYLEVWLQRVIAPRSIGLQFQSEEPICRIANGGTPQLWENDWISSEALKSALNVANIIVDNPADMQEIVQPEEVAVFKQNAWEY